MIELGATTPNGIEAQQFQQGRLPTLNFRGIAMTMAWIRVILMVQYIIGMPFLRIYIRVTNFLTKFTSTHFVIASILIDSCLRY